MIVPRLIERKRNGGSLTADELRELVFAYAKGEVPDYQMAAFLMAVYFKGLDRSEMSALMEAMLASGSHLDLSHLAVARIDKHSMGGVGDKTSLVLAPLIASLGIAVPMISGRGLGHTGGTLDKLESIPGFNTQLSLVETRRQVEDIGCALVGQTGELAPADRKMYALRDSTATIEVIPLIAASIMSKKLAESLTGLVIDIKAGSGSFLPELDRGLELAQAMIALGAAHGCPVVALVTAMDRPLGFACGNALEVKEAVEMLHGGGPPDFAEVTFALGAEMLLLSGVSTTLEDAHKEMRRAISSGQAAEKFEEIIAAQGGDAKVVSDPSRLPHAACEAVYEAPADGYVTRVEPRAIGHGVIALGGGRRNMEDTVDPSVGFVITAKPGDKVQKGQPLATIYARRKSALEIGRRTLQDAISVGDTVPTPFPLISHRVTDEGVKETTETGKIR
jgi:pyrimidine-nucleoside phosphorylase